MIRSRQTFRIGLVVNPLAGIGGTVALKGSDGEAIAAEALRRGAVPQAPSRAARAMAFLPPGTPVLTWGGDMGERSVREAGLDPIVLGSPALPSTPGDTRLAARALMEAGADLVVFAGGDGTARDLVDVIGERVPVLGIPAGCKMHSAVYALNPEAAGQLLAQLCGGELVNVASREVRDIDEDAFRQGVVRARYYGALRVPGEDRYVQQVKCGGREVEDLVVTEIAAWVADNLEPDINYLMGSGSTVAAVMEQLGLDNTLLGVDWVRNGEVQQSDLTAAELLAVLDQGPTVAIITVIGGQGHVFGRGNQQFSADVIRRLGMANFRLLASRTKLKTLAGRPLVLDTGDAALDAALAGLVPVITGYDDQVLYRLGTGEDEAGTAPGGAVPVTDQP